MSKKRFLEGLDGLFSEAKVSAGSTVASVATVSAPVTAALPDRRSGHKNFMSNLDFLLQEALEESLNKYESSRSDDTEPGHKSKSASREKAAPLRYGLDALIRQTIDVKDITTDDATGKRRLTVAVDKTQIDKLKTIARLENAFVKDLLVTLIDEYIDGYSRQKKLEL
jgi:hypothetical protein